MIIRDPLFGLIFDNIPIINLRSEFAYYLHLLQNTEFQGNFTRYRNAIHTRYFTWHGSPEAFFTFILQRAILGLESYITGAVYLEAGIRGLLNEDLLSRLRNPFQFGGRGTADNFYNRMPAIIVPEYSLNTSQPELWERTREFYRSVRNPLFHGFQLETIMTFPFPVLRAFEFIHELYTWIDSWHDLEQFLAAANMTMQERGEQEQTEGNNDK